MLAILHYKPLMTIDDEYVYLRPIILRKKTVIRLSDIKSVKMYELVNKIITSTVQAEQNKALIISLKDGRDITLEVQGLTKNVRHQIADLLSSCNLKIEFLPSSRT
jgi:hypothetical protein